jgi:hypothetical protein
LAERQAEFEASLAEEIEARAKVRAAAADGDDDRYEEISD